MSKKNRHLQKRSVRRATIKCIVALMLLSFGIAVSANLFVHAEGASRMYGRVDDVPARHTAIVLGARVYQDGTPSAVLVDRLRGALRLYRAKKVEKILVTGDHGRKAYNEVGGMFDWLRKRGVPASDIFLDHAGFRTLDSMKRAAQVFGVESAVICTQQFHLARAVFLARQSNIDAVGMVTDLRRYRHHYLNHTREFAARVVSVLETYILRRGPKFLGPPISIYGDGRLSQERPRRLLPSG